MIVISWVQWFCNKCADLEIHGQPQKLNKKFWEWAKKPTSAYSKLYYIIFVSFLKKLYSCIGQWFSTGLVMAPTFFHGHWAATQIFLI